MRRRPSRLDLLALAMTAVSALAGLAVLPRLPPEVAIHFSATSVPGTYVPRSVGITAVPVGMVLTWLVLKGAARIDPPGDARTFEVAVLGTMALLGGAQAYLLAWNLGHRFPSWVPLLAVLIWGTVLLGYGLSRHDRAG